MTRVLAALFVVALALSPTVPVEAQSPRALLVNFQKATPQGCGEWGGGAHYAYRVYVDGVRVHESPVMDPVQGAVQYYDLLRVEIGTASRVTVGFEVIDHAWWLFGISKHACNITAESTSFAVINYTVGAPQFVRQGSTNNGAAIEVYVSDTTRPTPSVPTLRLSGEPRPDGATLAYDAGVPGFTGANLFDPGRGMARLGDISGSAAGTFDLESLPENTAYQAQLRAFGGSWAIHSNVVSFTTANAFPPPPRLDQIPANATHATFEYVNPPSDFAFLHVYVGGTYGFTADNESLRATLTPSTRGRIELPGLSSNVTYFLLARVIDAGGATSESLLAFRTVMPRATPDEKTPASIPSALNMRLADEDQVRVAPGSTRHVSLIIENRGDVPLRVQLPRGEVLTGEAGLVASGWSVEASPASLTVLPLGEGSVTLALHAPAAALPGGTALARQPVLASAEDAGSYATSIEFDAVVADQEATSPVDRSGSAASRSDGDDMAGLGAFLAVVGAGAFAVIAWLLLRTEASRYALAVFLYTRIARSRVLDHPTRLDLHERIAREPGVRYSALRVATGLNTGALVHHLHAMERAGWIVSRKKGAYRCFYPAGAAPAVATTFTPVLTEMQERVLEALRAAPLTQGELAIRLGLSQQATNHHVKALERAGHLVAEHDGKAWRYRPVREFEVAR